MQTRFNDRSITTSCDSSNIEHVENRVIHSSNDRRLNYCLKVIIATSNPGQLSSKTKKFFLEEFSYKHNNLFICS